MVRSRLGLKALGLCALALGLMMFAASAAQAETGAKWTLLNAPKTVLSEVTTGLSTEYDLETDVSLTFLTEVSKKKVEISCTAVSSSGSKLQVEGKISEGTITMTGCTTKIGGALQGVCKPHSPGAAEGTVVSLKLHALLKLHSGTLIVLELPTVGGILSVIWHFIFGKEGVENECSIGEKLPVSGEYSYRDVNSMTQHQVKHLLVEFPALTELWALNKTAEHKTTIDGSVWMFLVGVHEGMLFAGLA